MGIPYTFFLFLQFWKKNSMFNGFFNVPVKQLMILVKFTLIGFTTSERNKLKWIKPFFVYEMVFTVFRRSRPAMHICECKYPFKEMDGGYYKVSARESVSRYSLGTWKYCIHFVFIETKGLGFKKKKISYSRCQSPKPCSLLAGMKENHFIDWLLMELSITGKAWKNPVCFWLNQ